MSSAMSGSSRSSDSLPEGAQTLAALPFPILIIGAGLDIRYINPAAEQFFGQSSPHLLRSKLDVVALPDSPLVALVRQVQRSGASMTEYDATINLPLTRARRLSIEAAPCGDDGDVVLSLHEQTIARKIDRLLTHRGAARAVSGLAAMLAHEVKNPLSGIKGAAQLLEQTVSEPDRQLTKMICSEVDRINALVERMRAFNDEGPIERGPVNIHEVLEHVRRIAEAGFARDIRFTENYDPSLPPVDGNRDLLIQVFLNLVKNAAEATPQRGGDVTLSTSFRRGVRLANPGGDGALQLPLVVEVQDNGPGIPDEIAAHLFDPFVTTKPSGSGLGLALVAKVIGDHGGTVEFDSEPRRTVFRVLLPMSASVTRRRDAQ